jgi:pimeloyl-ACP methyl ester carboxylesterase
MSQFTRSSARDSARRLAPSIAVLASLVACGDGSNIADQPNESSTTVSLDRVGAVRSWSSDIDWSDCGDGIECGSFEVPFDYDDPNRGTFVLPVTRRLADSKERRIGSLLVNPGGPGGAALSYAEYADSVFGSALLESFDIVAWDPRGVGESIPAIDCVDTMDDYFALDPSPDDPTERLALIDGAGNFADSCRERSGEILEHVSTLDAASDIDVLRRALGEQAISFMGFSYGTQLGATWATLFPETVRAAVFDAAVDPTLGYVDGLVLQAGGFERSFDAFLDWCDVRKCSFIESGSNARNSFDRLADALDANPPINDGRPATTEGVLSMGISQSLYGDYSWNQLADALDAARKGDGAGLLDLYDAYFGGYDDGHRSNMLDAYFVITCADRRVSFGPDDIFAQEDRLRSVAPRLGMGWIQEMLICSRWTTAPSPTITVSAPTANRIVVVGSVGDSATPLPGTRNMVQALGNARLIVSPLEQHTTYGSDDCVTVAVEEYLVELLDGPDELAC